MDRMYLIEQLERHGEAFRALFSGMGPIATFRPTPEKWCAVELVCHLRDEEREDFRARLEHVLATPEAALPNTDPSGWMKDRAYAEQNFDLVLADFLEERQRTVAWLRTLKNAPWRNAHPHPRVGPITADLFLVNWVAHDMHHLRQLNNLRYAYLASVSTESLEYAGIW